MVQTIKPINVTATQTEWTATPSATVDASQKTLPIRSNKFQGALPTGTQSPLQNSHNNDNFSAARNLSAVGTQTVHHDVHNHSIGPGYAPFQISDVTKSLSKNAEKQILLFDEAGVEKFVWSPIPTNIMAGHAHACCGNEENIHDSSPHIGGETYYMDDKFRDGAAMTHESYLETIKGKQYYDTSVDWQVGKAFKELPQEMKERIFPAITGLNLGDANSTQRMLRLFTEFPKTFYIFGECTMKKEFVDQQNQDYKSDFGPAAAINDIFKMAGRSGRPFILHCDSSDVEKCIQNDTPGGAEYFDDVSKMFQRHPETKFIWAHMGGVGKFSPPNEQHVQKLREVLEKNPHLSVDMSWDVVAKYFSPNPARSPNAKTDSNTNFDASVEKALLEQRIKDMAQLICDYPDRFIMGSDALISRNQGSIDTTYAVYSNYGRGQGTGGETGLFDRLPPDVLNKVLTGNFEAMMNQAVIDADRYDTEVLPNDLAQIQHSIQTNGRVPNTWVPRSEPLTNAVPTNTTRVIKISKNHKPPAPRISMNKGLVPNETISNEEAVSKNRKRKITIKTAPPSSTVHATFGMPTPMKSTT